MSMIQQSPRAISVQQIEGRQRQTLVLKDSEFFETPEIARTGSTNRADTDNPLTAAIAQARRRPGRSSR